MNIFIEALPPYWRFYYDIEERKNGGSGKSKVFSDELTQPLNGLTDNYVINGGGAPFIQEGKLIDRPIKAEIGSLFLDINTKTFYRYTGLFWEALIPTSLSKQIKEIQESKLDESNDFCANYFPIIGPLLVYKSNRT